VELIPTSLLLLIADISRVEGSLVCRTGRPAGQEALLSYTTDAEFMSSKEKCSRSYWTIRSAVPVQSAFVGTSDKC